MNRALALVAALAGASILGSQAFGQTITITIDPPPSVIPIEPEPPLVDASSVEAAVAKAQLRSRLLEERLDRAMERFFAKLFARGLWQPLQFGGEASVPFYPLQISFVPGVSFPFGYGDVGLAAGSIGTISRDIHGAAMAGVFNLNRDVSGATMAGVFNISQGVDGAALAGVFNIAGSKSSALMSAGVFNISGAEFSGAQLAGVFNIGEDVRGAQLAGVFNIADDYEGPIQGSGLFNIATRVRGFQAAPLFNIAERVTGLQLGLVNVADHIDGVQLGLINIAKNGVGGIGELFETNSGYRWAYWQNGTPQFYTVFMGGLPESRDPAGFVFTTGAGSRAYFGRPYLDLEVAASWDLGAAATSLDGNLSALSPGDAPGFWSACVSAASLVDTRPWPTLRLSLGVPIIWRIHAVGGLRVDLDVQGWDALPESMKTGFVSRDIRMPGFTLDSYAKWFLGFRI